MKKIAVYPGSFDPFHNGHLDVVERAAALFDEVCVMVGVNSGKNRLILPEIAAILIRGSLPSHVKNVSVHTWYGLTANFCRTVGAKYIVRGVRSGAEYDQEVALAEMNRDQLDVETVFFRTGRGVSHVSSSYVRELLKHDSTLVPSLVPWPVANFLVKGHIPNRRSVDVDNGGNGAESVG